MTYYFICFVTSWVLTAIYFLKWKSSYNVFITLSFIIVDVMTYGYWRVGLSQSVNEAILAQTVIYLGCSFVALLIMFSIFDICNLKVNKIFRFSCFALSVVVFASSLTIGYFPIFYKSVSLSERAGATVMIKDYGPMHTVYYISLGVYFLVALGALLYSWKKKKGISQKNAILLLVCFFVCIAAFAIGRIIGTLDLIGLATNLVLLTYIFISDRFVLYDVDATAVQTLQKSNYVGIVSFDLKHRFLGCNKVAENYFPELSKLKIDHVATEQEFLDWIAQMEKEHALKKTISRGDHSYSLEGQYLMDGKKVRGLQFILQDCTDEMEYQEYLRKAAVTDDMTHLLNRRAFEDEMKTIMENGMKDDLVIISFDLNGLKKVNDTIGHYAGDELICAASEKITDVFAQIGTVFRIGGDEFEAVAYCNTEELHEKLAVFQQACKDWNGRYSQGLSVSKGYALHSEDKSLDIFELVRKADKQMYSDKAEFYRVSGNDRRKR